MFFLITIQQLNQSACSFAIGAKADFPIGILPIPDTAKSPIHPENKAVIHHSPPKCLIPTRIKMAPPSSGQGHFYVYKTQLRCVSLNLILILPWRDNLPQSQLSQFCESLHLLFLWPLSATIIFYQIGLILRVRFYLILYGQNADRENL
jgi:hypothetical protein